MYLYANEKSTCVNDKVTMNKLLQLKFNPDIYIYLLTAELLLLFEELG